VVLLTMCLLKGNLFGCLNFFINLESIKMLLNQNLVPIKPTFVLGN
jgi:hypothetical protein